MYPFVDATDLGFCNACWILGVISAFNYGAV